MPWNTEERFTPGNLPKKIYLDAYDYGIHAKLPNPQFLCKIKKKIIMNLFWFSFDMKLEILNFKFEMKVYKTNSLFFSIGSIFARKKTKAKNPRAEKK